MTADDRKLVLVVDADPGFVDATRALVRAHRSLTARDLAEAREIVLGGRVDVVVLGPAFASEHSVSEAAALGAADPTARIVLVSDIVTNRLLKAALRAGFADVVDAPLDAASLAGILPLDTPPSPAEVDLVLETSDGAEVPIAATVPAPHHPSQYQPPEEPEETLGSGNGWAAPDHAVADRVPADPTGTPLPPSPAPDQARVAPAPTAPATPPAPVQSTPVAPPAPPAAPVVPVPERSTIVPSAPAPDPVPPHRSMEDPVLPPEAPPAPPQPVAAPESTAPRPDVPVWPVETPVPPVGAPPLPPEFVPIESAPVETPPPPFAPPPNDLSAPHAPAYGRRDEQPPVPAGPGRVIAVMAGKGGSGKSVVATNLAIALGMRHDPERVAIVDADLQFGDVALMLQVDPVRTLDDVVGRLDSLTDARLDAALLRHESGLRVLPAPLAPVKDDEITAKSVVEIVDRLRSLYDTIVVDTGPVFGDGLITILEHADAVVAVVDMDLPSVKNAKIALDTLRHGGFPMERITLVVNRVNSKARLDLVELERSLGLRVGGSVPSDRLVPQSVNEGIPLLALSPRSKVARSFMALAERLDPTADRARLGGTGR